MGIQQTIFMIDKLMLRGQEAIVTDDMILHTKIDEPFFTAGKQLGWTDCHSTAGIGLNEDLIQYASRNGYDILIKVGETKKRYIANPHEINRFCRANNSYWKTKTTRICVFPRSMTIPVAWNDENND